MAIVWSANPNLGARPALGSEVVIRDGVFRDLVAVVLDVDATGAVIAEVPGLDVVTTMERAEYLTRG